MGISGLWDSIPDAIERVSSSHLEGKVIAVDLACWVMADKSIANSRMVSHSKDKQVQNFFVRNLFSRVVRLLELGVVPVIVTDGKAPEAKMKTMASRLGQAELKSTNRKRFAQVLKKCTDLLDALGIQWISAPGSQNA
ncbi:unnamed protein product [Oikopleura dioica]|uniref:XPG N-terminal domain-containing protein n=1 Tax=Oikopleura dioica TaxID=34765 RepID=E4X6W3_OIKDI|nr:unnamed protein product [Oikopleura dioica]